MLKWLLIALLVGVGLLLWRMTAHAHRNLPRAGDAAPDFKLPDQNGKLRDSGEFRGKWLVLYFYPRDDTPGCTEQAARYRDAMRDIEALGATVCGVSVDDSERHAVFARKYNLPFALLADRNGDVARRHGSLRDFGFLKFARRNTFLIDPQGRVAKVYLGVSPSRNTADVTNDLKRLTAA
jgi:thioredoxin-dependent peroxiredoxin